MSFTGLQPCIGRIKRNQVSREDGVFQMAPVYMPKPLNRVKCRIDLGFLRQGKDAPAPQEAGRAPDRTGVMFFDGYPIRAGDIWESISGPISGSFEIIAIPDPAVGYSGVHHYEVQVREVNQELAGNWPASDGVTALPEQID